MDNSYRQYFDIDPDYFPTVNADIIRNNPDLWKKFFPHRTFISLIRNMVNVLNRTEKKNIWIEGAYGTGKSHAALTLKHLIDASEQETIDYFNDFKLDSDLLNKLLNVKKHGKILTVHRYASSSIYGDNDLFLAIQESIERALSDAGITNQGGEALKASVIRYLSDPENKESFGVYVKGSYKELFGGDSVDDIIDHLNNYTDEALRNLMGKIYKVAHEKQIRAFILSSDDLCAWIKSTIEENGLTAIVFIWDEFTEYFKNNYHSLTGFQEVLEKSATTPFCFIPVTHQSNALFPGADTKTKTKILDRFIKPTSSIELPENMAFQLMGQAMKKTDDAALQKQWEETLDDLQSRTVDSRKRVSEVSKVDNKDLQSILPIHPYAAIVLKHISTSFASNQRSMFDFIKNEGDGNLYGFQWFIAEHSDMDDNPLLTIDMLWYFFYERGKNDLAQSVRQVLDFYPRLATKHLTTDEKRVLKVILLLQAMSMEVDDSVELFIPNEKNLNLAFEGSDIENGAAARIAEKLVRDNIVYKKNTGGGNFQYSILTGDMDSNKIETLKKNYENTPTSTLITEGRLADAIELPDSLKKRCIVTNVGISDFEKTVRMTASKAEDDIFHLYCIVTFSKDDKESVAIAQKIKEYIKLNPKTNLIFIDCGKSTLSTQDIDDWVTNKATSSFYTGKDNSQALQYSTYAQEVLSKWRTRIKNGHFMVYSSAYPSGDPKATSDAMVEEIFAIDRKRFSCALEFYTVNASMWAANSLKQGVECGLTQDTKGQYRTTTVANKLENALKEAWKVDEYWVSAPSLPVSKMKLAVNKLVDCKLNADGRISIRAIYEMLKEPPFGFMACNISAFFIGFLLKEYVKEGSLSWSDGLSSDELTIDKFKDMVDEIIKLDNTPNTRYRDKYLVALTPEEKSFLATTIEAFDLSKNTCTTIEQARERVRSKMKELGFPLWTLNSIITDKVPGADTEVVKSIIELYCALANNNDKDKTDNDIALEIGKISMEDDAIKHQLRTLFKKENCYEGMINYLSSYKDGVLVKLAKKINDKGQYINELRKKFDADAANWVWRIDTIDKKIDELIMDYEIAAETASILGPVNSYEEAIYSWLEKCSRIKLPYQAIKDELGAASQLFFMLNNLSHDRKLADNKKSEFLSQMKSYGTDFTDIYNNKQPSLFEKTYDFYLQGLSPADINKIFLKLPQNSFTADKADFSNKVGQLVADYKKQMGSQRLKELWKEKTGTESPFDWSKKHRMPILAMIPENQEKEARRMFGIINSSSSSASDVEFAIEYLESATFFDALKDTSLIDKNFIRLFLGNYSAVITDIEKVKDYLYEHITDAPYHWLGSQAVRSALEKYAESLYNSNGYLIAAQKIDSMPAEEVKRYLKDMIKNNMTVGLEIIRNN